MRGATVLLKRLAGLRVGDRSAAAEVISDLLMAADGDPRIVPLAGRAAQQKFRLPEPLAVQPLLDVLAEQSGATDVIVHAVPVSLSVVWAVSKDEDLRRELEELVLLAAGVALLRVCQEHPVVRWGPFGLRPAEDILALQILHCTVPGLETSGGSPAPILHVHNVMIGGLYREHLLPIERQGLLRTRRLLGARVQAELARLVEKRGFSLVHGSNGVDWELGGVPQQAIEAFAGRQQRSSSRSTRRGQSRARDVMKRHFVQPEYNPAIFCEQVPAAPIDDGDREADEAGYLWCRCYSTRCPDGEMGHVHPDGAIELTNDEFSLARASHWRAGTLSRHTFDTEPDAAYWQVGWDQPTMTFFAQFYRVGDEDEPKVWLGLGYREYLSVDALQEAIGTRVPDDIRTQLSLDQKVGSFDVETGKVLDL